MTCCYLECVLFPRDDDRHDNVAYEPLIKYESGKEGKRLRWSVPTPPQAYVRLCRLWRWICKVWVHRRARRCRKITLIIFILLVLLAFLVIFVGIPLTFMNSTKWQRSIIFHPISYEVVYLTNTYNSIVRKRNLYVTVNKMDNITLGVWHIPHRSTDEYRNRSVNISLDGYPVVLFFHRENYNRGNYMDAYRILRVFFHVIAFDYRSYGDSSKAELTEEGIVQDSVGLYKWVQSQTSSDIYVWGDTLGAAIATHTISRLRKEGISPKGLVLQNPFTEIADQLVYYWPWSKAFSWLPWYRITMLDSLERNGLGFNTSKYISDVDCPIMILSYESNVVPYIFGIELGKLAKNRQPITEVNNVTFNIIPWFEFPRKVPGYMSEFLNVSVPTKLVDRLLRHNHLMMMNY